MVGTEILFVLVLFVVRAMLDCTPSIFSREILICSGHSLDSFTNMGEDPRTIRVNNPQNTTFVVDKSKNQHLHLINTLDLRLTEVLVISENGFKDFASLSTLILVDSSIEALDGTWFLDNNNITYIDCSHNKLTTLSKSDLENLKKLNFAAFSRNLLESIEPHAFSEMKELRELRLDGNKLKSIPTGSFPMLEVIRLHHNFIEIVPANAFTEMPKIITIHLQHNELQKIEDEAFKDLKNLNDLFLSNNFIEEITEFTFVGMSATSLRWLDLSSNKIQRILPGAFKEMPVLKEINFSHNLITELNEDIIEGLDVEILTFDFNKIEIIDNNTFRGLKSLVMLFLDYNKLHSLTPDIFGTNLQNLQRLYVTDNNISEFHSEVFKFTPNILVLAISSNYLQFLPEDTFIPLTKLKKLNMRDNLIEELTESHIDSLQSLEFLHIDHNKLTFIPLNRDSLPNLRQMNIGGNPWQCPCLDEIQDFLTENDIEFFKEYYFDGQCPICVPTYFEPCKKDLYFSRVKRILKKYKNPTTEQCRIEYLHDQVLNEQVMSNMFD